jgi:penicillin-binding protein 1A
VGIGRSEGGGRLRLSPIQRLGAFTALAAALTAVLLLIALLPVGAGARRTIQAMSDVRIPPPHTLPRTTYVYDRYGHLLTVFHGPRDRRPVALSKIPKRVRLAVIAAEDEHFFHEGAVNAKSTLRAAWIDLVEHAPVQGGSTITQQYVKDVYTNGARTVGRKIREGLIALKLSRRLTKKQILARYLNEVYFGHGAYGIEAAALTYFGIPAMRLSTLQAATLAGIISAPTRFDPIVHPAHARARRNYVLAQMAANGFIRPRAERTMLRKRVRTHPPPARSSTAPYFLNFVEQTLQRRFGKRRTLEGGLSVRTTIDPRLQQEAEAAVRSHLARASDPDAALVAIDPSTGEIRAMVGGRDFKRNQYNLATQAHRQAGSAFKPFTLAAATAQRISLLSRWNGPPSLVINDRRCYGIDPTTGAYGPWHVSNYADESAGTMTLLDATANSVNTIFSQVVLDVGPDTVASTAHRMGIASPLQPVCSITLGTQPVTPLDMTTGYSTLAADGVRHTSHGIVDVTTPSGHTLMRGNSSGWRVLSQTHASLVTYALQGVITHGTGTAANIGRPAAGKTGTAENYQDAWFCGYVPQLVTCVWVGYRQGEIPLRGVEGVPEVFGGSIPAEIWHEFMGAAVSGMPVESFPTPSLQGYNLDPHRVVPLAPPPPPPRRSPSRSGHRQPGGPGPGHGEKKKH